MIEIEVNDSVKCFELTGDLTEILNNRRISSYLSSEYQADFTNTKIIRIPYIESEQEAIFVDLERLFQRHGIKENRAVRAKEIFSRYLKEEEDFARFADKAKRIWNNDVDLKEFTEFVNVIESELKGRKLYDLQVLAAFHLAFSQNACNFSVPGAGKTSIVYAAYAYLRQLASEDAKHLNKILVIGPLSSFAPWEMEYEECFGIKPRSKRLSGGVGNEERTDTFYSVDPPQMTPELLFISYQGAATCVEEIERYLQRTDHHVMVVLDEAHRIKNTEGGIWANAVLRLSRFPRARVVLTGTPAPNGYQDLYNLFKFIWPHKDVVGFSPAHLREMSEHQFDGRVAKLVKNVAPYFIRIKKSNLELPIPTVHTPERIVMGPIQKRIYEYLEGTSLQPLAEASDYEAFRDLFAKARLIRLMQAASNPLLLLKPIDEYLGTLPSEAFITNDEIISLIKSYESREIPSKYTALLTFIAPLVKQGEKIVIWAIFIESMHKLSEFLENNGISNKLLYGATPVEIDEADSETREGIIREFHSTEASFKVLIANPFAVGESISLHKATHRAIYLEKNFNAAMYIQSKDRIHRVGLKSDDKIDYHFFVSADSIEETIHDRLAYKEARMLKVIEGQDIPLISLNMEDDDTDANDIRAVIDEYLRRNRGN